MLSSRYRSLFPYCHRFHPAQMIVIASSSKDVLGLWLVSSFALKPQQQSRICAVLWRVFFCCWWSPLLMAQHTYTHIVTTVSNSLFSIWAECWVVSFESRCRDPCNRVTSGTIESKNTLKHEHTHTHILLPIHAHGKPLSSWEKLCVKQCKVLNKLFPFTGSSKVSGWLLYSNGCACVCQYIYLWVSNVLFCFRFVFGFLKHKKQLSLPKSGNTIYRAYCWHREKYQAGKVPLDSASKRLVQDKHANTFLSSLKSIWNSFDVGAWMSKG